MTSATRKLTEPHVLAHTKRQLFPEEDTENTYAIVDTQFAIDHWVSEEAISEEIKEILAPFNHVQVGSGYPDLVGVRNLESDFLAVERFGDDPISTHYIPRSRSNCSSVAMRTCERGC
jgi:hypothetical protein